MNNPITKMSDIPKRDLVIGGVSAIFLIATLLFLLNRKNKREEYPAYTKGVIVDKDIRLKGNPFIIYNFAVENKIHRVSVRYSHGLQEINIGDTCYVVYEQDDPTNNGLLKLEEDERCFKIKKPD